MTSEYEKFLERIKEKAREKYSEAVVERILNPRNTGVVEDADGYAKIEGPCGDTMEIWVKMDDDIITNAGFVTDGCGTTLASGSMATELAIGKSADEAQSITQQDVLNALGGLPEDSEHCALLAANTLKAAVADYLAMKREPWKKSYRKY